MCVTCETCCFNKPVLPHAGTATSSLILTLLTQRNQQLELLQEVQVLRRGCLYTSQSHELREKRKQLHFVHIKAA